jgi:predicted ArsR family transcriptional regulator
MRPEDNISGGGEEDMKKEHEIWGEAQKEREDGKYIAVLRDIEPAVAKELGEAVGVSTEEARRRLEKLYNEDNPPVARKKINGSVVWSLNEPGIDARADIAVEEVRRRLGLAEKQ